MNIPRIEAICRIAAVVVWALGAFGKLFSWLTPTGLDTSGSCASLLFALVLGVALWGASIVLPDVFSVFKLPPPKP